MEIFFKNNSRPLSPIFVLFVLFLHLGWVKESQAIGEDIQWANQDRYNVLMDQLKLGIQDSITMPSEEVLKKNLTVAESKQKNLADSEFDANKTEFFYQKALAILFWAKVEKSFGLGFMKKFGWNEDRFESASARYHGFLDNFRKALQTDYYKKNRLKALAAPEEFPLVQNLQDMALVLYAGVNIQNFQKDLVAKMSKAGGYAPPVAPFLKGANSLQRLEQLEEKLHQLPKVHEAIAKADSSLKITVGGKIDQFLESEVSFTNLDPNKQGSISSIKMKARPAQETDEGQGQMICLRMATPTMGPDKETEINPEFQAYLMALKQRHLKHTYINLQDNRNDSTNGNNVKKVAQMVGGTNEFYRAQCIEGLNEKADFKDVIRVISLAKNSDFYHQRKEYGEEHQNARDFLVDFIHKLFDDLESGFYLPKEWRDETSPQRLEIMTLLNSLHLTLFEGNEKLSLEERKNFLEVAYLLIGDYASKDAFSSNRTCKDGIDRAGGMNAFTHLMMTILSSFDQDWSDEEFYTHLESLNDMIHADALANKKREIIKERLDRYKEAGLYVIEKLKKDPDLIEELKKLFYFQRPVLEPIPGQIVIDPNL